MTVQHRQDDHVDDNDNIDVDDAASTATTTDSLADTDTLARARNHIIYRDAVPWAGGTFIIVDKVHGRILTFREEDGQLEVSASPKSGYHWLCVETNGWLGFCDRKSGKYMGHNGKKNFQAKVLHHKGWEYFCARRHPDGGYLLLTTHWDKMLRMDVGEDGRSLVARDHGGALWEFVKV